MAPAGSTRARRPPRWRRAGPGWRASWRPSGPTWWWPLGATAGKALLGPGYRVTASRGSALDARVGAWSGPVLGTIHPSAVLRVQDPGEREDAFTGLVADLAAAAALLA